MITREMVDSKVECKVLYCPLKDGDACDIPWRVTEVVSCDNPTLSLDNRADQVSFFDI
jgi:hypothetical protein